MRTLFQACLAIGLLILYTLPAYAESPPPKYALGLGLEVSSGSFGSAATNTYVTMPLILDWYPTGRLDFELTVPLLYQRTSGSGHAFSNVSGPPSAKPVARGVMGGNGGNGGSGGMSGTGDGNFGGDYGFGDITLTSGYSVLQDSDTLPQLRPTLYVKFPVAATNNGFGTGKFDYGAGMALSKWLGDWLPFAEGRYVFQGGGADFVTADAGVGYSWSERLSTSLFSRFGTAQFDGIAAPLEGRLKLVWRFAAHTYTDVYALKGFSAGSPDYGGGAAVFMEF